MDTSEKVRRLVREHVHGNITALIQDLHKANPLNSITLAMLFREDWRTPAKTYIEERMNEKRLVHVLQERGFSIREPDATDELKEILIHDLNAEGDWAQFCEDLGIVTDAEEVTQETADELWVVSDLLALRLNEQGELVNQYGGVWIWSRFSVTASVYNDPALEDVAESFRFPKTPEQKLLEQGLKAADDVYEEVEPQTGGDFLRALKKWADNVRNHLSPQ